MHYYGPLHSNQNQLRYDQHSFTTHLRTTQNGIYNWRGSSYQLQNLCRQRWARFRLPQTNKGRWSRSLQSGRLCSVHGIVNAAYKTLNITGDHQHDLDGDYLQSTRFRRAHPAIATWKQGCRAAVIIDDTTNDDTTKKAIIIRVIYPSCCYGFSETGVEFFKPTAES